MLAAGLAATALIIFAITPAGVYDVGVVLPMFVVIIVGLVIVVWAGIRGRKADEARDEDVRSLHPGAEQGD